MASVGDRGQAGQAPRRNSPSQPVLAGSSFPGRRGAGGQERRLSPSSLCSLQPPATPAPGLVTSAITGREIDGLWRPRFPTPELVAAAAAMYPARPAWSGVEGPSHRLTIAPGALTLARRDLAKAERYENKQLDHHARVIDQAAITINDGTEPKPGRSRILAWSGKSRARMVCRLAELDWSPIIGAGVIPAMVTLTYPGDWLTVAPDAAAMDAHLRAFYRRWERAWGEPLVCAWKKEYQRRGAPHWCAYLAPPRGNAAQHSRPAVGDGMPFHRWLSAVWADVVDHPDPEERRKHLLAGTGVDFAEGMRSATPKRLAVYFTKHGQFRAKEYQNHPPAEWREAGGCGRFWGYRGLHRATVTVELSATEYLAAARTLRRWARAQKVTRLASAPRARGGRMHPATREVVGLAGAQLLDAHRVKRRTVRRRARYLHRGAGFVCVNDGPALAAVLARYVERELP